MHVQELDVLEEDATVYKLIGPVLVKQDLSEAKQTVEKRLDYIRKEMYAVIVVYTASGLSWCAGHVAVNCSST